MARLLDEQKRRMQQQPAQGRTVQVQKPGAVQTLGLQSTGQQPAQTQQTAQTQKPAEQHTTGSTTTVQNTTAPAVQPAGQDNNIVTQAQQLLSQQLGNYQNRYGGKINELVAQLQNRPAFEYDVNADPTYQMLREIWTRDGKMAMEDTMGQAAQLTGGYGNSYAQTAGQQTYQGYMRGLNEMVPDLKEAARADYDAETNNLLQQYSMLMEQEGQDYSRWMDALERQRYDEEWAYQKERDALGDQRYDQEWAYQKEQDERDYMLNLALAAYEMGDDSLVRALGINPQDYGASSGRSSSGGSGSGGGGGGGNDLTVDPASLANLEKYYGNVTEEQIEALIAEGVVVEEVKDGVIYYRIVTQENPKPENPSWEHAGHQFTGW